MAFRGDSFIVQAERNNKWFYTVYLYYIRIAFSAKDCIALQTQLQNLILVLYILLHYINFSQKINFPFVTRDVFLSILCPHNVWYQNLSGWTPIISSLLSQLACLLMEENAKSLVPESVTLFFDNRWLEYGTAEIWIFFDKIRVVTSVRIRKRKKCKLQNWHTIMCNKR